MINPDSTEKEPKSFPGPNSRRPQYKFTAEEFRVIRECNRESFYKRCIPISTVLGCATYYGVKSGYLKPTPRFGATPRVIVSVVVGYFVGKLSYQGKCAQKLMQLPNSQIGEMLRQKRRGTLQESLDPGFGPGMSLAPFGGISSSDTYSDLNPNSSLDMDVTRPESPGLDDFHRPSVDNPIYEEEMPPIQKNSTSYDELRKKNREEYQQKRIGNYRQPTKSTPGLAPHSSGEKSQLQTDDDYNSSAAKNKYGDIWG